MRVRNSSSSGRFSHLARAPVATMRVRALDFLAFAQGQVERPLAKMRGGHLAGRELGAEPLRLAAHPVHELRAEDPLGEAGVVVDVGGEHQLAAGDVGWVRTAAALDDQRIQFGARGVEGRRQARGARTEDDHLILAFLGHDLLQ